MITASSPGTASGTSVRSTRVCSEECLLSNRTRRPRTSTDPQWRPVNPSLKPNGDDADPGHFGHRKRPRVPVVGSRHLVDMDNSGLEPAQRGAQVNAGRDGGAAGDAKGHVTGVDRIEVHRAGDRHDLGTGGEAKGNGETGIGERLHRRLETVELPVQIGCQTVHARHVHVGGDSLDMDEGVVVEGRHGLAGGGGLEAEPLQAHVDLDEYAERRPGMARHRVHRTRHRGR